MSTIAPPEVVKQHLKPTQSVKNLPYTCYNEQFFNISPTFNKWVPLMIVDILNLDSFMSVYHKSPDSTRINKSLGPYMFINHPINYVSVVGICIDTAERYTNNDKVIVQSLTIDDGSSATINAVSYFDSEADIYDVQNKVVHIQGLITEFRDQRQIRITNLYTIKEVADEFLIFKDILKVRTMVLSKPWVIDPDIIVKAKNKLLRQKNTGENEKYNRSLLESLKYIYEASGSQEDFQDTSGAQDTDDDAKKTEVKKGIKANISVCVSQRKSVGGTDDKLSKSLTQVNRLLSRVSSQEPSESCSFMKKQPHLQAPLRKKIFNGQYSETLDEESVSSKVEDEGYGKDNKQFGSTKERFDRKPLYARVRSDYENYSYENDNLEDPKPFYPKALSIPFEKKILPLNLAKNLVSSPQEPLVESENLLRLINMKQSIDKDSPTTLKSKNSDIQVPSSLAASNDSTFENGHSLIKHLPIMTKYSKTEEISNDLPHDDDSELSISVSQGSNDIIIESSPQDDMEEPILSTQNKISVILDPSSQLLSTTTSTSTSKISEIVERKSCIVTPSKAKIHQHKLLRPSSIPININGFIIEENDINKSLSNISRVQCSVSKKDSPMRLLQKSTFPECHTFTEGSDTTQSHTNYMINTRHSGVNIIHNEISRNWNSITTNRKSEAITISKAKLLDKSFSLPSQSDRNVYSRLSKHISSPMKFSKHTVFAKLSSKPTISSANIRFTTDINMKALRATEKSRKAESDKRGIPECGNTITHVPEKIQSEETEKTTLPSSQTNLGLGNLQATSTPVVRNTGYSVSSASISPIKIQGTNNDMSLKTLFEMTPTSRFPQEHFHDSNADILVPATYKPLEMKKPRLPTWHSSNSSSSSLSQASQISQVSQISQKSNFSQVSRFNDKYINSQRDISKVSNTSGEISLPHPLSSSTPSGDWYDNQASFLDEVNIEPAERVGKVLADKSDLVINKNIIQTDEDDADDFDDNDCDFIDVDNKFEERLAIAKVFPITKSKQDPCGSSWVDKSQVFDFQLERGDFDEIDNDNDNECEGSGLNNRNDSQKITNDRKSTSRLSKNDTSSGKIPFSFCHNKNLIKSEIPSLEESAKTNPLQVDSRLYLSKNSYFSGDIPGTLLHETSGAGYLIQLESISVKDDNELLPMSHEQVNDKDDSDLEDLELAGVKPTINSVTSPTYAMSSSNNPATTLSLRKQLVKVVTRQSKVHDINYNGSSSNQAKLLTKSQSDEDLLIRTNNSDYSKPSKFTHLQTPFLVEYSSNNNVEKQKSGIELSVGSKVLSSNGNYELVETSHYSNADTGVNNKQAKQKIKFLCDDSKNEVKNSAKPRSNEGILSMRTKSFESSQLPASKRLKRFNTEQHQPIMNHASSNRWSIPVQVPVREEQSNIINKQVAMPTTSHESTRTGPAFKSTFSKFQRFLWETCSSEFNKPNIQMTNAYSFTVNNLIKIPAIRSQFELVVKYWASPTKNHEKGLKMAIKSGLDGLVKEGLILRVGDIAYQTINRFNLGYILEHEQNCVLNGQKDEVDARVIVKFLKCKGDGWRSYPNRSFVAALIDKWLSKNAWVKVNSEGVWQLGTRSLNKGARN